MPCPPIPQPNADEAIDEEMIKEALASQGTTDWQLAESLDLSFRKIAVIENIVCFDKITKLSLSNNRIKEANNLSHLVSLTSLDLSFNSICKVPKELALLVNLKELSFHSNGLQDLTTIDQMNELKVLNVGRNQITSLDTFLPLRKLPHLRALMAAGNPCAEKNNDDYESFVLAYLGGQVRWLDYRVISNDKVQTCKEQFQNELELLAQNEDITKAEIMQAEKDKISQAALRKIYMLEAFTLFDVLMTEDIFLPKISRMEGLNDLQDNLKKDLTGIVNTLRTELTAKCELINVDESEFRERLITLYQKAQEQSLSLIKGLKRSRKILFNKELMCSLPPRIEFIGDMPPTDMGHTERKLRNFRLEVNNVKEDLEALETNVQSAALALIDRFEDNYSAMMTANIELLAEFFQKAINFANRFHDSLKDTAVAAVTLHLDSQGNGDNEDEDGDGGTAGSMILDNSQGLEDMDEDVLGGGDSYISLLSNVDSMMEVVNASHEKHESIILNKDEAVRRSIREKLQTTIANVKTQEFDRSRLFLKDIVNTTNELITSAEDAFEVLKAKLDRY